MLSNELIRIQLPLQNDYEADVSRVCLCKSECRRAKARNDSNFYGANLTRSITRALIGYHSVLNESTKHGTTKLTPSSAEMVDKCIVYMVNFSSRIIKFRGLFSLRLG